MGQLSQSATAVAFEQAKADIDAVIAGGQFIQVNRDAGKATRVMLTGYGNVERFLADIRALPHLRVGAINTLERNVNAFLHADALVGLWRDTPEFDEVLLERVRAARRVLVASFELLQARGVMDKDAVKLSPASTPLDQLKDVRMLGLAFLARWDQVGALIGNDRKSIEDALTAADQLTAALAAKDEIEEGSRTAAVMRNAAWTLAVQSWQELERAVEYLRYHEKDFRKFLPSPFVVPPKRDAAGSAAGGADGASGPTAADGTARDSAPETDPAPVAAADANIPVSPLKPSKPFE
jgi:hypothetical protein